MLRESFLQHFSGLTDYRQDGKIAHPLMSVLFIAVSSYVAFCDDWDLTVIWAQKNIGWLRQFVDLPHGIPSKITFYRIFRSINPRELERRFIGWTEQLASGHENQTVPIDGKTLRGARSGPGEKSLFHIVSAWASDSNLSLGFYRTDVKSNEITAIPELLKLLSVEGAVVTIDAMGAQKQIARQIVEENRADYVLGLKKNQPSMFNDAVLYFAGVDPKLEDPKPAEPQTGGHEPADEADVTVSVPDENVKAAFSRIYRHFAGAGDPLAGGSLPVFSECDYQFCKTRDMGHGRIENRLYFLATDISWLSRFDEWAGLKSAGMVITHTVSKKDGKKTIDGRFFISSLNDVDRFSKSIRDHWSIEASHNILDVTFCEDKKRAHKENGALSNASVRRIAVNMLSAVRERYKKDNPKKTITYRSLRFKASLDPDFLEEIMIGNMK